MVYQTKRQQMKKLIGNIYIKKDVTIDLFKYINICPFE